MTIPVHLCDEEEFNYKLNSSKPETKEPLGVLNTDKVTRTKPTKAKLNMHIHMQQKHVQRDNKCSNEKCKVCLAQETANGKRAAWETANGKRAA